MKYLNKEEIEKTLSLKDLTEDTHHAIGMMVSEIKNALESKYGLEANEIRTSPIVDVKDNYDRLYYPQDTITKSSRYTRWIDDNTILRTQMTACIPNALSKLNTNDSLMLCPGMVYRRDVVDKTHVGEPHQMDVWRVTKDKVYNRQDLLELVETIINVVLPGVQWRYNETSHYYTKDGIEVEVYVNDNWLEILECGLALPELLSDSGLNPDTWSGLALGIGLDRAVMLRKGIADIRILRSDNPKISKQMSTLLNYISVSSQPQIKRDLSIAVDSDVNNEDLGDIIRNLMGDEVKIIEQVVIISETKYEDLLEHVRERLGMTDNMKNILLRVIICPLDKAMTKTEANEIYTHLYSKLHQGNIGYTINI
jgi:phenylalanyl-tRNA synthetase alpha chain